MERLTEEDGAQVIIEEFKATEFKAKEFEAMSESGPDTQKSLKRIKR